MRSPSPISSSSEFEFRDREPGCRCTFWGVIDRLSSSSPSDGYESLFEEVVSSSSRAGTSLEGSRRANELMVVTHNGGQEYNGKGETETLLEYIGRTGTALTSKRESRVPSGARATCRLSA